MNGQRYCRACRAEYNRFWNASRTLRLKLLLQQNQRLREEVRSLRQTLRNRERTERT